MLDALKRLLNPPEAVVEIRSGRARVLKGKVTDSTLSDLAQVGTEFQIRCGRVYLVRSGGLRRLEFSSRIPDRARQRLRNVWVASR
jgi:hypothetical protein